VARSGAHLLCEGLRATQRAGRPLQYFHQHLAPKYAARYGLDAVGQFSHYVRGIVSATATSNGVFGFRSEPWDMNKLVERLSDSGQFGKPEAAESELLRSAFPRLRCVQLTREDKVRQAVSKARAMQTNHWLARKEKKVPGEPQFDPALIAQCEQAATQAEEMWAAFFRRNGIEPFAVTYEELCRDYPATVARVLDFLHIRPSRGFELGPPRTSRQADATTEEWVRRYTELRIGKGGLPQASAIERGPPS
jgi:LPS sulfotransferase NodH